MDKNDSLILLATYNGTDYIRESLDSFSEHADIYVSDDCSLDDTVSIIRKLKGNNILISEGIRHGSAAKNFRYLINSCDDTYKYYFLADQDDNWTQDKYLRLKEEIIELESKHGVHTPVLIYGDSIVVDEKLKIIDDSFFKYDGIDKSLVRRNPLNLFFQNVGQGATMIFNRALLKQVRIIPEKIYMHDWWLMLYAQAFGVLHFSNSKTLLYRQHSRNSIGAQKRNICQQIYSQVVNNSKVTGHIENVMKQIAQFDKAYRYDIKDVSIANFLDEYRKLPHPGFSLRRKLFLLKNKIYLSSLKRTAMFYIYF
jgi:glycosyltransferase involved in cell wall biosynthesis